MNGPTRLHHGGRLIEAARRWNRPPEQWLDLSTGINPLGWPVPVIPPSVWQRLPDDDDGLEDVVRDWCGAPTTSVCVPVPGSQAAIQTLPRLRRRCRVGVPEPGYAEHAHGWVSAGHEVRAITDTDLAAGDDWLEGLDVVVWINPNNPTGLRLERDRMLGWLARLQSRGGWLVVDEAFLTARDSASLAPVSGQPGLVVLKSLGKFFGLAGVRAGAVLTDGVIGEALSALLGPWSLSGPARFVMARALRDTRWQNDAETFLQGASQRLGGLLAEVGLPGTQGTLLFRYLRHSNADRLQVALAEQGVLVRHFDRPGALRLGLPGTESDWQKLARSLRGVSFVIDH
ncbi:threonine-phosphate decarboxylase CobD [Marinobacter arenosus]|uniref:threonine-phosphate decarboxylase CobD n=1 Tax=Marinobacter arenosus TaxID=2856822 RepID=UPI001C4D0265|nr:threonine-phosphate decarboxylase CobD [Marinobacter arenosus]MBW0148357.1 threonine-phosphate decarboxylase CobD [Marinobacter arenosus]